MQSLHYLSYNIINVQHNKHLYVYIGLNSSLNPLSDIIVLLNLFVDAKNNGANHF